MASDEAKRGEQEEEAGYQESQNHAKGSGFCPEGSGEPWKAVGQEVT